MNTSTVTDLSRKGIKRLRVARVARAHGVDMKEQMRLVARSRSAGRVHGSLRAAATRRQRRYFWTFVLPALAIYVVFWIVPLLANIPLSLTRWNGVAALTMKDFVGFANFSRLAHDAEFGASLVHNVEFTVVTVLVELVLSLGLALMVEKVRRLKSVLRTILVFPTILPFVVVAFLWTWIYQPSFGLLNGVLGAVGLRSLQGIWLGNTSTAFPALMVVAIWQSVPFFMILFMAALQGVPQEQVEAAQLDGANYSKTLRYVVLPFLRPVTVVVGALLIFNGFRLFDIVYIMTAGGPGFFGTQVLSVYIYQLAFSYNALGYGSAVSIVLAVIVFVVALLYLRLFRQRVEVR